MKEWALNTFGEANIANNFEEEEIDGNFLLSSTVRTTGAMEKLGLTTIGKKGKFRKATYRQAYDSEFFECR